MSDRPNQRRVLHFAVSGMLLGGAVGCTSNEKFTPNPGPNEGKPEAKQPEAKQPETTKLAPNPGPNDLEPPDVAPTTAVKPETPPVEPIEVDRVNEGPVKEPPKELAPIVVNEGPQPDRALPEKRVNTGPVKEPEPKPPIKVNPGPEGNP